MGRFHPEWLAQKASPGFYLKVDPDLRVFVTWQERHVGRVAKLGNPVRGLGRGWDPSDELEIPWELRAVLMSACLPVSVEGREVKLGWRKLWESRL